MTDIKDKLLHEQLINRRTKLEENIIAHPDHRQLQRLLSEVDEVLESMSKGTYGLCQVCNEPIEVDRLLADPLVRVCLDHLSPHQQKALEEDLELAKQIQHALLPKQHLRFAGWEISYHYEGAGPVSGDYCDFLHPDASTLYFMIGDVSGKGIAASMLMAHLHASFRTLVSLGLPLEQITERASRMFCESTLATHFATLVCGRATGSGEMDVCNAGHPPPLLIQSSTVTPIEATGLPLGMFCQEMFAAKNMKLSSGDSLFLYTDGFSETQDVSGSEYGADRMFRTIGRYRSLPPDEFIAACVDDMKLFRGGSSQLDDTTIMVVRRSSDGR